jgi:hypothetical protein
MNYYQVKVLVSDLEIFNINAQNETIAKIKLILTKTLMLMI